MQRPPPFLSSMQEVEAAAGAERAWRGMHGAEMAKALYCSRDCQHWRTAAQAARRSARLTAQG